MSKEKFVHLHMHSSYSALDGAASIDAYAEKAVEMGHPGLACTEHGTLRGMFEHNKVCNAHGIKPIFGIEFYVCEDMNRQGLTEDEKSFAKEGLKGAEAKKALVIYEKAQHIKTRYHLTVWAKNEAGIKNLYKLSSKSFIDGFYYKPRVDFRALFEHREGLIIGSGCLASKLSRLVQDGDVQGAIELSDKLKENFGSDYYLEIQPHDIDDQRAYNKFIVGLHSRYGGEVKLLATQDAHYANHDDHESHDVLLCIGTHSKLHDKKRMRFDGTEYYYKSRREMEETFGKYHDIDSSLVKEALDSTVEIFEKAEAKMAVSPDKPFLPDVELPIEVKTPFSHLQKLCIEGWKTRGIVKNIPSNKIPEYIARLKYELGIIKDKKFENYFLIVWDLVKWAKEKGIFVGPGRGSGCGSIIAYLTGITALDPIRHKLIFERFISPARTDLPDFDIDFAKTRRHEVFEYLIDKYGRDNVAQISTIGALTGKSCFKDCSRVYDVLYRQANQLSALIPDKTKNAVQAAYDEFKDIRDLDKQFPGMIKNASKLEGLKKNPGIHAAGVVASPIPLDGIVPLEIRKSKGKDVRVVAFEKKATAAMGLVKLDILGLNALSVLSDCLIEVEKRTGKKIDPEVDIPIDDKDVLSAFSKRDFAGIFQFDSSVAINICEGVKFNKFEDIVLMAALNRPGAMAEECLEIKKGLKRPDKNLFHPAVYEELKETFGVLVFQEQLMSIAINVAGWSPGEAERLRIITSSAAGSEEMNKLRGAFVDGCKETAGVSEEKASLLMDAFVLFGEYSFNLSHAVAYSLITYWCMYLKVHYPAEFYYGLLKNEEKDSKAQSFISDMVRRGIKILPPDVSTSERSFSLNSAGEILYGLADIKGVGEGSIDTITKNRPYSSFGDFLDRTDRRKCNKTVVNALVNAGAFDAIESETALLTKEFGEFWDKRGGANNDEQKKMLLKQYLKGTLLPREKYLAVKSVMPHAFGLDEQIDSFIKERLKTKVMPVTEYFFETNKSGFVCGSLVDSRTHKIGDYIKESLTEEEKKSMFWGKQYANCEVEFKGGFRHKIRFDIDTYEDNIDVIKANIGTNIMVFVSVSKERKTMSARFAINVDQLMRNIDKPEEHTYWQKVATGLHPLVPIFRETDQKMKEAIAHKHFDANSGGIFCGVITNVRSRTDKQGRKMSFVGIFGISGFVEVTFWGKQWEEVQEDFVAKNCICVKTKIKKNPRWGQSYLYADQHKVLGRVSNPLWQPATPLLPQATETEKRTK